LTAQIDVLPVRGGDGLVQRMFEPLGYQVETTRHPLDVQFSEWGESPYFSVTITGTKLLSELLAHLYVLIPVFDNEKHYFVGEFRHSDHRFEWTRQEFQGWSNRVAGQHGYNVRFVPVGPVDELVGSPTQMGLFERKETES